MRNDNYAVIGDDCTELQVCATFGDADMWLQRYIRRGDWGGYESIGVYNAETLKVVYVVDRRDYEDGPKCGLCGNPLSQCEYACTVTYPPDDY